MDASILKFIRLALEVISDRLITILGLSMSFGLGCWTMWDTTWERVTTLTIFVIFTYLTIRSKETRNATRQEASTAA